MCWAFCIFKIYFYRKNIQNTQVDYSKYQYHFHQHKGKNIIVVKFPYDQRLPEALRRRFPSATWSKTLRAWYLPDLPSVRRALQLDHKTELEAKLHHIDEANRSAYRDMHEQLLLKKYSPSTVKQYLGEFNHLLRLLKSFPVDKMTPKRLKDYFLYCAEKENNSERSLNGKINAIKFYFEQVRHQPKMFFDIPRPKKPQVLPKALSKRQVKRLFSVLENKKHLVALQLCYGMGLRVSEVVNLMVSDIDSDRMMAHIRGAKGKKDRYVPLPTTILPLLRAYYLEYGPKEYLLEGQYGGQYSKTSVQQVFKKAMRKAGIEKNIGIHGLRHSYATHLLESGADMRFIQELLGHNSIKTTQVYTKVTRSSLSKISSPLDVL